MSAGDFQALRSMPLQAANALARYERHVRKLVATWLDLDLYRKVSDEVDTIKQYCSAVPELGVAATSLLISHAELIHALWHRDQHVGVPDDVEARLLEHLACIDALARRCLRSLDRDDEVAPHD